MDANKELGQHFMINEVLLKKIVDLAVLNFSDNLLEIGPGHGALTKLLVGKTSSFITVDVDERFKASIHGNILDIIDDILFDVVVSNLPYHICEPLFVKFISIKPKKIVVIVGDQFARHLQEETILGIVFRELYVVNMLQNIPPESFDPQPKVNSALIKCELKPFAGILADFYSFPKSKVKNYLKTKTSKREAQEFINKLPIPLQEKRLYELNKNDFLELKKIIKTM